MAIVIFKQEQSFLQFIFCSFFEIEKKTFLIEDITFCLLDSNNSTICFKVI